MKREGRKRKPRKDPADTSMPDNPEEAAELEKAAAKTEGAEEAKAPEVDPPDVTEQLASTLGTLVQIPFEYRAEKSGKHWNLSPKEVTAAGNVVTFWANMRLPVLAGPFAPELAVLVVALGLVVPRLVADRKIAREKAAKEAADKEAGRESVPGTTVPGKVVA